MQISVVVSQEWLDDWAVFREVFEREMQKALAEFTQTEFERVEKEIMGDPDAKPVGLLSANPPSASAEQQHRAHIDWLEKWQG